MSSIGTLLDERRPRAARLLRYASPQTALPLVERAIPWLHGAAALLALAGLYIGLLLAPTDFQQGDAYRIIFVHVPAAWLSMLIYVAMAFWPAWDWCSTRACRP